MELISRKDNVEAELKALGSVLDSVCPWSYAVRRAGTDKIQHGVNMETRLMTPDGFPRDDLDIAQSTLWS